LTPSLTILPLGHKSTGKSCSVHRVITCTHRKKELDCRQVSIEILMVMAVCSEDHFWIMAIAQRTTFGSWLLLRVSLGRTFVLVSIFLLLKLLSCYSRTQLEHSTWLTMKMVKFGVTFGVVWGLRESDWIQMESETVS